ncbi:DUF6086 family protein [Haloglycomyces albus]|uniref:DUF6086 family protein n=1 Tax=Haloglycomyces albus TaxID=526067 RepID=UPI00046D195A|nr:DUF6086 family protein [Haloglycomyces albus]
MSIMFDVGDTTIWNPSNGPGRLFVAIKSALETDHNLDSGISNITSDECKIDPPVLRSFLSTLIDSGLYRHDVGGLLQEGFIITSLALLNRCGDNASDLIEASGISPDRIDQLDTYGLAW